MKQLKIAAMFEFNEKIIAKEIEILNRHLAKRRKSLAELLKETEPSVELRDNKKHYFDRDELLKISNLIPEKFHSFLKLPIYIELSAGKYGKGISRISGKFECMLISKILERELTKKEKEEDFILINRIELRKIRRELKTATQYMFAL